MAKVSLISRKKRVKQIRVGDLVILKEYKDSSNPAIYMVCNSSNSNPCPIIRRHDYFYSFTPNMYTSRS